jgi:selenocysteine lyase/cysteine desulfurase
MAIENVQADFGPFEGKTWINCAHQGPLPRVSVDEAHEAISLKNAPYRLTTERFSAVPQRIRKAIGKLISALPEDIILGNSASYGLHLLANGIPWESGDEVLLLKGDFPSDILPWLALERKGVRVRLIEPRRHVLQADELKSQITPATRLFCTTWVHSFSGRVADEQALGQICRENNVIFVMNCTPALGARPFDVQSAPVDAIVSAGHKWLLGPYATGFCWMRAELRDSLEYNQAYWLAMQTADDLGREGDEISLRADLGARAYDVFGTANFFNFKPWAASIEYLLGHGIDQVARHNADLVSRLIEGLDPDKYELISPRPGPECSTLVLITHRNPSRNRGVYDALEGASVCAAFRRGRLRFSPHIYNTAEDIDRALSILNVA